MKAAVLIVDDDAALRRALGDRFRFWGHSVTCVGSGAKAIAEAERKSFDLILLDLAMPVMDGMAVLKKLRTMECEADIVVLTAHGSLERAVEAMKHGADDFLSKPADFELLKRIVERALEKRQLKRVNQVLSETAAAESKLITGPSMAMERLLETAQRAAQADTTVLLVGESGTGKQVVSEYIHQQSPRRSGAFVYVNCVAISDELIESTLFGHEKGAFTGAVQRKMGRLEAAAGGTAFLDEIGDVSSNLQTKLLHFLESSQFERVGGNQTIGVDCRIIAATNKDLVEEVKEERFREDLFYRLNVIALRIPPLRERIEDIPILADAFLRRFACEMKREDLVFAPNTMKTIESYSWPGNVRQLKNAVERMVVLATGNELTADLLPPEVCCTTAEEERPWERLPYKEALVEFKRRLIAKALARADGNQTRAAESLGIQRTYLNRLVKELSIEE
jgi:DNA-binding NtrC family response regulator